MISRRNDAARAVGVLFDIVTFRSDVGDLGMAAFVVDLVLKAHAIVDGDGSGLISSLELLTLMATGADFRGAGRRV